MASADLYRVASVSSWIALVALVLAGVTIALFFGGAGAFWGPINDGFVVVTVIALIPAVVAVARMAGAHGSPWTAIVSVAAIAGLILIAVGQTLLILGRLSLEGSFVTGGVGVIPVIVWIVMVAALSLRAGVLPTSTGWLAVATLGAIVADAAIGVVGSGPALWVAGGGLFLVLSAWLVGLATTFGANAVAAASAA